LRAEWPGLQKAVGASTTFLFADQGPGKASPDFHILLGKSIPIFVTSGIPREQPGTERVMESFLRVMSQSAWLAESARYKARLQSANLDAETAKVAQSGERSMLLFEKNHHARSFVLTERIFP